MLDGFSLSSQHDNMVMTLVVSSPFVFSVILLCVLSGLFLCVPHWKSINNESQTNYIPVVFRQLDVWRPPVLFRPIELGHILNGDLYWSSILDLTVVNQTGGVLITYSLISTTLPDVLSFALFLSLSLALFLSLSLYRKQTPSIWFHSCSYQDTWGVSQWSLLSKCELVHSPSWIIKEMTGICKLPLPHANTNPMLLHLFTLQEEGEIIGTPTWSDDRGMWKRREVMVVLPHGVMIEGCERGER